MIENSDDIKEVDMVGGFVPVNKELSEIRSTKVYNLG